MTRTDDYITRIFDGTIRVCQSLGTDPEIFEGGWLGKDMWCMTDPFIYFERSLSAKEAVTPYLI